ncbi:MAG: polymerase subunit sigma-70 [Ilumatobacteraceae bacterium]|nr:polymerase subunit sigma-70 [Ilumatobacteraceae bacterium]
MTNVTDDEWTARTDPFRGELLAHCYRMLGSFHDAEDLLQDTMVRAWLARERFDDERASLRTWLYRIASNVCLTALSSRSRRPLPSGLGQPPDDPEGPFRPAFEVAWLEPFPDAALDAMGADPSAIVGGRGSLRIALVAAMQLLPPRQRAALILREVVGLSAAEIAAILDASIGAVNSALQRARATLAATVPCEDGFEAATRAIDSELIDRYVEAFERADVASLTRLVAADVLMEMPPFLNCIVGPEDYGIFMRRFYRLRGTDIRTVRVRANGEPAFCAYVGAGDGSYHVHTLQVLTCRAGRVIRNTVFQDPVVFETFGLPRQIGG